MKVVVGMSGGVDSSVSALLLKEAGHEVIGLFMKNWEEKDGSGSCLSSYDYEDVVKVCEKLAIPYYTVNFVQEYWDSVFSHFIDELKAGYTPNPDILCNREIKFKAFFQKALALGADKLATGHYAREQGGRLLTSRDTDKDQTYFLYTLQKPVLERVLFPIGHLTKQEVRSIAKKHGLATSEKKDSTGICFIGERDFRPFLQNYITPNPGPFETPEGKVVGEHIGAPFYTIGQRKGLAIGGAGEAWFVVGKDMERNVVIVAQGAHHPALYQNRLTATDLSWVVEPPSTFPYVCQAKIRYRQPAQNCLIEKIEGEKAYIYFPEAQRAITPRQAIVFYQGAECLGGGLISSS